MKFIVLALLLSIFGSSSVKEAQKPRPIYEPYQIYVRSERQKAPLEGNKCMKGAYIHEEALYSDIDVFEKKTGIENDIYISLVSPSDDFPSSEVIQTYAKGKLPFIILEEGFDISRARDIARVCGNLNIPMLVEIRGEDKFTYESCAGVFRELAPKTALVYGTASDSTDYEFPDEELVDWVALDIKENTKNRNIVSEYENAVSKCDYFRDKAVMLNISVPNFTIDGCSYIYKEASDEIKRLYSLASDYSNVGAVNYISRVEKHNGTVSCNYRITENEMLVNTLYECVNTLSGDRYWSRTSYIAYASADTVLTANDTAERLSLEHSYVNSGFCEIRAGGFNKSERKIFVKS